MKDPNAFVDALEDLYGTAMDTGTDAEISFWMFVEWYEKEYGHPLPLPDIGLDEFTGDEFDDLRVWFDTNGK